MQQVQDQLNFKIHTPTDEQLAQQMEFDEYTRHIKIELTKAFQVPQRLLEGKTRNQKKRERKKQRNARRLSRV